MQRLDTGMLKLIVNADDFGISHEVNEAICECFAKRMISSTTLMVNMPYADEAVRMANEYGFDERVGLHLNLTSGKPLTSGIEKYRCFCSKSGKFNAAFEKNTRTRLHLGRKESLAAFEETEAQMRKYIEYGLPDRHLDSHHHVHTDRSIFRVAAPLIHRYDFRSVRLSRNMYGKISVLKKIYKARYNKKLKRMGVVTSDYFGSFEDFRHNVTKLRDNALVEIMVHPMYSEKGILVDTKIPMEEEHEFILSLKAEYEFY